MFNSLVYFCKRLQGKVKICPNRKKSKQPAAIRSRVFSHVVVTMYNRYFFLRARDAKLCRMPSRLTLRVRNVECKMLS